jgi:hypothetical protein
LDCLFHHRKRPPAVHSVPDGRFCSVQFVFCHVPIHSSDLLHLHLYSAHSLARPQLLAVRARVDSLRASSEGNWPGFASWNGTRDGSFFSSNFQKTEVEAHNLSESCALKKENKNLFISCKMMKSYCLFPCLNSSKRILFPFFSVLFFFLRLNPSCSALLFPHAPPPPRVAPPHLRQIVP